MCMKKADPKASVCITNSHGRLGQCVVGLGNGISPSGIPWKEMSISSEPLTDMLERENSALINVLERFGAEVLRPERLDEKTLVSYFGDGAMGCGLDQQFPRGCVCIVANDLIEFVPSDLSERTAMAGLYGILRRKSEDNGVCWYSTPNCPLLNVPEDYPFLDSRDILQLDDKMVIGYHKGSNGTNREGFRWMRNTFAFHDVRGIELPDNIHLAQVLSVPRPGLAVVCRDVVGELPSFMSGWDVIDISREEAEGLLADCLSLDERTVVIGHSDADPSRLASELSAKGLDVVALDFTAHIELGGSVGSSVLPLRRAVPQ